MDSKETKHVIPGDVLAYAEEYLPGKNTIEEDSRIISLCSGEVVKNDKELTANVDSKIKVIIPRNGDIVYGNIVKNDSRQTTIQIAGIEREGQLVYFQAEGYIRSVHDYKKDERNPQTVRIGDIIRGKVIRVGQNLELTLSGSNLGVLKSRCSRCREILVIKNGTLFCENCNRSELRKAAPDYGEPEIEKR